MIFAAKFPIFSLKLRVSTKPALKLSQIIKIRSPAEGIPIFYLINFHQYKRIVTILFSFLCFYVEHSKREVSDIRMLYIHFLSA